LTRAATLRAAAPFIVLLALDLTLAVTCIAVLSAARAYVGGEGLWAKAQKEATLHLLSYAGSRDESEYARFLNALAVPLGDRQARLELDKPDPDPAVVFAGFRAGRNHADDIVAMARLYRWFGWLPWMRDAAVIWREADGYIGELFATGERLHVAVRDPAANAATIGALVAEVRRINDAVTPLEDEFSYTLGRASRGLAATLAVTLAVLASVLGVLATVGARRNARLNAAVLAESHKRAESEAQARMLAESETRKRELLLTEAQAIARLGSWEWDPRTNRVTGTDELLRLFGFDPGGEQPEFEDYLARMHPTDREAVRAALRDALDGTRAYDIDYRVVMPDGTERAVHACGEVHRDGGALRMTGTAQDVTERKRAELALEQRSAALARSNADLEQFAYVASHDLQEPLRMVTSYLQLLARRYQGRLDRDADEFIGFAVDGAARMRALINDLLAYSRVGTRGEPVVPTAVEEVLAQARANLQLAIGECGATLTHDPLPTVPADPAELAQLLQNLIGNALKFRGAAPPRVHVSAKPNGREWLFAVADNGIGLDPQYRERIFTIFQRLHTRDRYPGTGVGLAICKKIVERHGGRIWVESKPDEGATFYFTMPRGETAP
jgi:signal transduction histidine kinase